jgi:WD40 repeat protein
MSATTPPSPQGPTSTTIPLSFVPDDLAWSDDDRYITADGLAAVDVGTGGLLWQGNAGGGPGFGQVAVAGSNLVAAHLGGIDSPGERLRAASVLTGTQLWLKDGVFGLMALDAGGRRIGVNASSAYLIFDLTSGAEVVQITRTPLYPFWPAFSPAGTQLAIASPGSLAIADTATGAIVHELAMPSDPVIAEFDDSGSTLTCVDRAARVTILDATSGAQISQSALDGLGSIPLTALQRPVALSPDRRIVAVVTEQDIAMFLASTGRCLGTILTGGEPDGVCSVVFSPDARAAAVSHINAMTGTAATAVAKLIAAPLPRLLWEQSAYVVSAPAFSRTGRLAVAQGMTYPILPGVIEVVDTGSVLMLAAGAGSGGAVLGVDVTGGGIRLAASICADSAARLYAVDGGQLLYEREHPGALTGVVFAQDGQSFATASTDGGVRLFDTVTGGRRWLAQHSGPVNALARPAAGDFVCTASSDKTVRCIDAATGTQRWQAVFPQGVTRVIVSRDGGFVVAACSDRTARLLHAGDGVQGWQVQHDARIDALAISPDGALVATASEDGSVRVLASDTGSVRRQVSHVRGATSAAFSADGQAVISGSLDGAVLVSPVADPAAPSALLMHAVVPVTQIATGPGRSVAVVTQDGLVRVIDLDLQAELARINSNAPVNDIAIDTAAGLLASGSDDGTLRVDTWGSQ